MSGDTRREFEEFYPGGGRAAAAPAPEAVDSVARARLDNLAAAVGTLGALSPDGAESLADVKERINEVAEKVAEA